MMPQILLCRVYRSYISTFFLLKLDSGQIRSRLVHICGTATTFCASFHGDRIPASWIVISTRWQHKTKYHFLPSNDVYSRPLITHKTSTFQILTSPSWRSWKKKSNPKKLYFCSLWIVVERSVLVSYILSLQKETAEYAEIVLPLKRCWRHNSSK